MFPFDIDLARVGYLRSPDGRQVRHIPALDELMRDVARLEVMIRWASLPSSRAGYCSCRARMIVLADWLAGCFPWAIRRVLSHELAHVVVGPSEDRVVAWQRAHYGPLIDPPDWGVW